ncbi:hypothetical protein [Cellulomonas oligotrophica]|uniref:Uncharacterized protein n=1 Tax=Cellulomonas oligotrophica TaxID=931536 RepID=A0A7Y9FG82_9CELL|nr:hypothetical protein [Cellulomonas oligotrophica]NYD86608.1 hypothetical protein [Cellulomonas oligotrophica]GIG32504.1 hypothetical protein Col01nite_16630 [Cellulomonas oligotrophica]
MDGRDAAVDRPWVVGVAKAAPGLVAALLYAGLVFVAVRLFPDVLADAVHASSAPHPIIFGRDAWVQYLLTLGWLVPWTLALAVVLGVLSRSGAIAWVLVPGSAVLLLQPAWVVLLVSFDVLLHSWVEPTLVLTLRADQTMLLAGHAVALVGSRYAWRRRTGSTDLQPTDVVRVCSGALLRMLAVLGVYAGLALALWLTTPCTGPGGVLCG